ncbi:hypothetical protein IJD15_01195 [bacterium]|nr:hypothetical protein [bacterium]
MNSDKEKGLSDNNKKKSDKNVLFRILLSIIFIIVFFFILFGVKDFSKTIVQKIIKTDTKNPVTISEKSQRELEEAILIYGVVYGNTDIIRDFCSETGYIPEEYINLFENSFYKTSQYMNKLFDEFQKKYKMNPISYYKSSHKSEFIQVYENDYALYKKYSYDEDITKKAYCMSFDKMKKNLVSEKISTFAKMYPNIFFDSDYKKIQEKSRRYVNELVPENFLAEKQYPETELLFSKKWDLFNLYKFQSLTEKQRIIAFENMDDGLYTMSDLLIGFVEPNKQYQIAQNYCISKQYKDGTYNLGKVNCTNYKKIEELPYEHCEWFTYSDEQGVYYVKYDLNKLWDEFKSKGIEKVEEEIENEVIRYKENNPV